MIIKLAFVIILLGNLLHAQCNIYYILNGQSLTTTANVLEALKFDNYFVDVRTNEDFGWVPSYLSSLSISSRFNEAMDIWENSVNAVTYSLYIYQNQTDGVEVFFTISDKNSETSLPVGRQVRNDTVESFLFLFVSLGKTFIIILKSFDKKTYRHNTNYSPTKFFNYIRISNCSCNYLSS